MLRWNGRHYRNDGFQTTQPLILKPIGSSWVLAPRQTTTRMMIWRGLRGNSIGRQSATVNLPMTRLLNPISELAKSSEGCLSLHLIDGLLQRSNPSLRLLGGLALAIVVVRLSTLRSESSTIDERLDDDLSRFAGNQGVYLPRRIGLGLVGLLADLLASGYRLLNCGRVDRLGRLRWSLYWSSRSRTFGLRLVSSHVHTVMLSVIPPIGVTLDAPSQP